MSHSSAKTAVVGLGSFLCRDDAVGIHVLEALRARIKDDRFAFLDYGAASAGLVAVLGEYDRALLIDAMDAGLAPGLCRIFRLEEAHVHIREEKLSSHEMSLADLLGLIRTLGLKTDVRIAGIQVKDVSHGLEMTQELAAAEAGVVDQVAAFLSSWGFS